MKIGYFAPNPVGMRVIFSTDEVRTKDRFRSWRDVCEDRIVPMDQRCLDGSPFSANISAANVGGLAFTQFDLSNLRAETTPGTLRHENNKTDYLFMSVTLNGAVRACQYDHSSVDNVGEFSIRDTNRPWTIEHKGATKVLAVQLPREPIEAMLGPARRFCGLTVGASLPTAILARSFLRNLLRLEDQLSPSAAERMAGVGIELIIASLAERMATEAPKALHRTMIRQRAISFIAANLGDPALNPSQVAAAAGTSLRLLYNVFRESGRSVGDVIWTRRLEAAARCLSNAAYIHVSIGEVAYQCGFADQAHFSRRFRDRYEMSPRDYRFAVLSKQIASPGVAAPEPVRRSAMTPAH